VVPFGVGTSLEGHITPLHGGLSMDLTRMNRILEVPLHFTLSLVFAIQINDEDFNCRVEAGLTRKSLNEALRTTGKRQDQVF